MSGGNTCLDFPVILWHCEGMLFKERIKGGVGEMKSRYNVSACDEIFGSGNFLNILEWNQLFEGFEIFSNTFILFNSRSQLFVWHKMLLYRLCLDSTDFVIFNHSISSLLHYSYNIFPYSCFPTTHR